jgi:signal peptidase II
MAIPRKYIPLLILFVVLIIDQWSKFYVKNNFYLGEEISVIGDWFRLHFTENYGMAFGMEFGGKTGKVVLTIFRIIAVAVMGWYIVHLEKLQSHVGYIVCWTLIAAGALGNIVDSIFYGVWFGYDTYMHGRVVDMFYFPIIQTTIPDNFPFWAGEDFEFFRPVFNVADAAISVGFIGMLLFQKTFIKHDELMKEQMELAKTNDATNDNIQNQITH